MNWKPLAVGATLLFQPLLGEAKQRPVTRAEIVPSSDTLTLASPGVSGPIAYERFGSFENEGTTAYRYVITDKAGLAQAAGEGIFPNNDVMKDPAYQALKKANALEGSHWTFVDSNTSAKNFYKWASTNEDPGVKQFYEAIMLERAGLIEQAVKAFYAIAVHFPKTISYTYYDTPWYVGPSSLDRVTHLLRRHPKIKMELKDAHIHVERKYDNDKANDVYRIKPGRLVAAKNRVPEKTVDLSKLKVVKTIAGPRVQLKQYENRHWQLTVDGKPFPIKAVTYSVTPAGASPDRGTWNVSKDWQTVDKNNNGQHDGFDESYIDKNQNNRRDDDEKTIGDGRMLQDLGANSLRAYHHLYSKELFRRLYEDHGIHILCGDLLGVYAVGSGATWTDGTDYSNPKQREAMLASVKEMVEEYKDEPYIVMWVLGNENVYGVANNSGKDPDTFYKFVNEAAQMIHKLDPSRPVAISNGDLLYIDYFKKHCPDVDIFGCNVYRGEQGFGRHLFLDVQKVVDRPVMITEYGVSAIAEGYTPAQAEAYQAMYLANNWEDLEANMAGRGVGNALGGVLFEFMDEWWKANSDLPLKVQKARADWYAVRSKTYKSLQPENHDDVPQFGFPFLDGWSYEEWYGLVSQGDGKDSPFSRVPRQAYFQIRDMWKK